MVLGKLFRRNPHEGPAHALYAQAVEQARRPEFYGAGGVPDTLDGRFDLVALHVFLVLHRLKSDRERTEDLAQAVFDTMFLDMDQSLRELGAGDLGVGKRVRRMAEGLYGRIAAYEAGLNGPEADLEAALSRNLYGTVTAPNPARIGAMAAYVRRESARLAGQDLESLLAGEVRFGPPPDTGPGDRG